MTTTVPCTPITPGTPIGSWCACGHLVAVHRRGVGAAYTCDVCDLIRQLRAAFDALSSAATPRALNLDD